MPFNPTEFYEFASWMKKRIPASGFKQSVARTIISRSYYSALLHSSAFTHVPTVGGHDGVINALKSQNLNAGNKLFSLKILRQKADYELPIDVNTNEMNKALRDTRSLLTILQQTPDLTVDDYLECSQPIKDDQKK